MEKMKRTSRKSKTREEGAGEGGSRGDSNTADGQQSAGIEEKSCLTAGGQSRLFKWHGASRTDEDGGGGVQKIK
jgi:hypothetical protein